MTMTTGMSDKSSWHAFIERAVEQRRRAGALMGDAPTVLLQRDLLLTMALRNETAAEVRMRRAEGHPIEPAVRELQTLDARLVELGAKLRSHGIDVRRKK